MSDRDGSSIVWFLAGLGIGAVAGILFAPQSGTETRDAILSKAEEGRELMRERARRTRQQAGEWIDRGKEAVNQQKEQFRSAYEAGRQAYKETTGAPVNDSPSI
jgi:gas vesicle protein